MHHLANLAANDDTGLQFILTILPTLGLGETFGWHGMVFWCWSHLARTGTGDSPARTDAWAQPCPRIASVRPIPALTRR